MEMFDTEIQTLIREDGTAEQKAWLTDDALRAEELQASCDALVLANGRFEKIAAQPEVVSDPKLNALWWDRLEELYVCDKHLWRLFVGEKPCPASNRQYAAFRKLLLESLKANA